MAEWAARCPVEGCGKVIVTQGFPWGIRRTVFLHHAQRCHRNFPLRAQGHLADLLLDLTVQTIADQARSLQRENGVGSLSDKRDPIGVHTARNVSHLSDKLATIG